MRKTLRYLFLLLLLSSGTGCKDNPTEVEIERRPANFTLTDLEGNEFTLSSTEGQIVVLNFFATWCPTCQAEVKDLAELHEEYADQDVRIIGIAIESGTVEAITEFRDFYELPYPILVDDGNVSSLGYQVRSVPTNFFIDKEVNMYGPYGPLSKAKMTELIRSMLSEQ